MSNERKRIVTVTVRPEWVRSPRELDEHEADIVRQKLAGKPVPTTSIALWFGKPEFGWLSFVLSSGRQRVEWSLSDSFDPFQIGELDGGETEHTFTHWLERLTLGQAPALVVDQEGPYGVVLVSSLEGTLIRVSAAHGGELEFDIAIDRLAFVRSFYGELVAFWESGAFRTHWSHWSDEGRPQWSIRSELIERAIG